MNPIRILLADDHGVVRNGFRMILAAQWDMEVVGEASNGRKAVEMAERLSPDVVVMDGFTGNVILKSSETLASSIVHMLKEEIRKRPLAIRNRAFLRPVDKVIMDPKSFVDSAVLLLVVAAIAIAVRKPPPERRSSSPRRSC